MHDDTTFTPPTTPSHSKSNSASSDYLASLSSLRRGDSTASRTSRPSLDESCRPGSTELMEFPHDLLDYEIQLDGKGRKKPIGSGAWSDVYLAVPTTKRAAFVPVAPPMSPPLTPVHSRASSATKDGLLAIPPLYAIKVPASTSAKKVLNAEARILSHLSQYTDGAEHIIPFFGQDNRTGALVLQAMDGTLEDWIQTTLSTLDDSYRATKLASTFPALALSLIDSLIWMQDKNCIHADIKPSNILYSTSPSSSSPTPHLVFSDFSSTVLTIQGTTTSTPAPMGAGTWEFLDPSLLSSFNPATPSASTDLYSLAITLLFVILGASPFDGFKHNKFQQREMIKSGAPLQCLGYDDEGIRNLKKLAALSRDLGFDVKKWFAKVLVKDHAKRVDVREWREELVEGLKGKARL
ncbi:kinase-like domain-containing protein [Paraphoma chrysanthemicola]|nr:kinase-like domain-containing protein [Paraphoma chrysanthemicola]